MAARDDEAETDDGERQEGQEGEVSHSNGLDVVSPVDGDLVERIDAVNDRNDEHEETGHNRHEEGAEEDPGGHAPSKARMISPQDALDKDQVDDEDEEDTGTGENLGGEADTAVCRVAGPDDAHDVCGDTRHGEAEEEAGEDELVAAAPVALEDCHVEGGGADEEDEDDGGDGDIDFFGWDAAEGGVFGGVGGALEVRVIMLVLMAMIFV